jgi:hypothetical protein
MPRDGRRMPASEKDHNPDLDFMAEKLCAGAAFSMSTGG